MEFKLTETQITVGADRYDLKALSRWKMYSGNDGKIHLKIVPEQGKPEMYEVEPDITFRDVDGNVVSPDYWIVTYQKGMTKPECVIRIGDMDGRGTFEVNEPKKRGRKKLYGFSADDVEPGDEDDGA